MANGIQGLTVPVLLVGVLLGCPTVRQDLPARIERIATNSGATLVTSEDLSDSTAQRVRWQVRLGSSWSDYCEAVTHDLVQEGFQVETFNDVLTARKASVSDTYHVEFRRLSPSGARRVHNARIEFTGTPF